MGSRTESIKDVAVQLTAENADRIKAATKGAGLEVYAEAGRDLDHYSFFHYGPSTRFSCNRSLPSGKRLVTEREWMAILKPTHVSFPITFPLSMGIIPALEAMGLTVGESQREWVGRFRDVGEMRVSVPVSGRVSYVGYIVQGDGWPTYGYESRRFESAEEAIAFLEEQIERPPFDMIQEHDINWNASPTDIEVGCTPVTKDQVLAIATFKGWI